MRLLLLTTLLALLAATVEGQSTNVESWRLVEELRIGARDGPEALSGVDDLTVAPDGADIYVALPQENTIRVFSASTGEFIRTIGRSGEGPGEFRMLTNIGWAGDSLYATDFALQRFSLFSPYGDHHRTEAIHPPLVSGSRRSSIPRAVLRGGAVVLQERLPLRPLTDGSVTSSPWALFDPADSSVSTVGIQDLRDIRAAVPIEGQRVHTTFLQQPLSTRNYLAIHPDGRSVVVVDQPAGRDTPGTYTVTRIDAGGKRMYSRRIRYRPVPVTRAYADSLYAAQALILAHWMGEGRAVEMARRHLIVPQAFPPVGKVVHARDDAVWLRRVVEAGGAARWLVFDDDGRMKASAVAPAGLQIMFADASQVWGVLHDEFEVPYVVKLRIER